MKRYIRQPQPGEDEELCRRCRTIDFEAILSIDRQSLGAHGYQVFELAEAADPTCDLCNMFRFCSETRAKTNQTTVDHPQQIVATAIPDFERYGRSSPRVALRISYGPRDRLVRSYGDRNSERSSPLPGPGTMICWERQDLHDNVDSLTFFDPHKVNYEFLAEQIQLDIDSGSEDSKSTLIRVRRLIDCNLRRVIPAQQGMEYATLSYVWGTGSDQIRYDDTGRLVDLPRTIEDAMTVTTRLGGRYLWVDRICIDQQDNIEKADQIGSMNEIFSNAWVTIVSLAASAGDGLPGVSRSRSPSLLLRTSCYNLFTFSHDFLLNIGASPWNTRGWTFQEGCLSQRLLYFTNEQVFLTSRFGTIPEIFACVQRKRGHPRPKLNYGQHAITFQKFSSSDRPGISYALTQYFRKALKFEEDALAAFQGYLGSCGLLSHWGVPLLPTKPEASESLAFNLRETGFLYGLLWYQPDCRSAPASHKNFPSWSWASRRLGSRVFLQEFTGPPVSHEINYVPRVISWASVKWVGISGCPTDEGDTVLPQPAGSSLTKSMRSIWIEGRVQPFHVVQQTEKRWRRRDVELAWALQDLAESTIFYPDAPVPGSTANEFPVSGNAILLLITMGKPDRRRSRKLYAFWLAVQSTSDDRPNLTRRVGLICCVFRRISGYKRYKEFEDMIEKDRVEGERMELEVQ